MKQRLSAQDEFIDSLLLENGISLRNVYDYAEGHMNDLETAENIYSLNSERDKKLCLSIFRLISEEYAAAISNCFNAEYNINNITLDDSFFEENKLFLIAAFIYNPQFFARSWNLCGLFISHLAYEAGTRKETKELSQAIIVFWVRQVSVYNASGEKGTLKTIWSEEVNEKGIRGKLAIKANNKDDAGELHFRFRFSEYSPRPPFFLRVHYATEKDGKEHTAELTEWTSSKRNRELAIFSITEQGIKYAEGLTITNLEILAQENIP